jgi:pimeloyl-ACP methyl ester carboxylesterase
MRGLTVSAVSHRGPGVIVATCLLGAPAIGLVLLLLPFAGAPEHIINGVFFLALATGWAALAFSTTWWSSQPQRWAFVPAAALLTSGLVSLAWNGSVDSAVVSWGWPVGLVALVLFVGRSAQRHLRSRARGWILYPILSLLTLMAAGGFYEDIAEVADVRAHPAPGRMIDVRGTSLHLNCQGHGGPTVVLIAGFGEASSIWGWIATDVSRNGRVCSYDPAGRAWSESSGGPQSGADRARDLRDLLRAAGESGPFVLVGHSLGGLYARVFAADYPEDVAGMVLLDATHPDMFSLPSYPGVYDFYRRVSALFPSLARFGVGRLAYRSSRHGLPDRARAEALAFLATARLARSQRDEWAQAPIAMAEARALTTLGDRPLVVVTAARGAQEGWLPLQRQLTELSTNAVQRIQGDARHMDLLESRDHAAQSSGAIRDVLRSVRAWEPLESE